MSLKFNLTHPKTIRKAVAGGLTAGAAALANAIVEVSANGVITDPAFHVSNAEWSIVFGAVVAGVVAVYSVKNGRVADNDGDPDNGLDEDVQSGEANDLPESEEDTKYNITNPELTVHRPVEF